MCQNSFLNTQKQGHWCGSRGFSNVPELIFEHSKTKSTVWLTLFLQCARIKSCFVFLFVFYHDSIDSRFVHEHFRISKRQTPGYKFKKHKTPVPNTKSIITKRIFRSGLFMMIVNLLNCFKQIYCQLNHDKKQTKKRNKI